MLEVSQIRNEKIRRRTSVTDTTSREAGVAIGGAHGSENEWTLGSQVSRMAAHTGQRLALYQAQVQTSMEYCSHLWGGSAKYQLKALDSVDRRARRIIGDKSLTQAKQHSLQHRRNVACLSVFYRIYFSECAQELHNLVPLSPFYHRTARHRERWHPYVVDIPSTHTKRFLSVSDTFC
ncbi:jg21246 [Pararge aegeria aegeria]|uniref:Jg21246 protein n=1 Tax=Pararge aegeria aegeria TaxID=348720 RepID=A0A8S4RI26_9NEOP|nr:jg21246 [Pararge aegeria aegeria]